MTTTNAIDRLATAARIFMTLVACLVLLMICQTIIKGFASDYVRVSFPNKAPQISEADQKLKEISDSRKEFLFDGTVLLVKETTPRGSTDQNKTVRVADANDRTLYDGPLDKSPYSFIQWSDEGPLHFPVTSLTTMAQHYGGNVDFSQMLCVGTRGSDGVPLGTWVFDPAIGAFTGYDFEGRITGYLGAQGLCLQRRDIEPFEQGASFRRFEKAGAVNPMALWVSAYSVHLIDFGTLEVRRIFHWDDDRITSVQTNHWEDPNTSPYLPCVGAFTADVRGAIYLPDSQRLIQIQAPSGPSWSFSVVVATRQGIYLRRQRILGYPQTRDRAILLRWWLENRDRPKQHLIELMKVQDDGDCTLVSSFGWTQPPQRDTSELARQRLAQRINQAVSVVSPLPDRWVSQWFPYNYGGYWWSLVRPFIYMEIHWPSNLAVTLVLTLLTFFHAWPRRTGWGKLVFWIILVMVFNLAGLLTYLALNSTPVIHCQACNKKRGLLRADCPACHSLLPPPKPKPTDLILSMR
jgi:hypothetical protein